jgi:hypothetical protein
MDVSTDLLATFVAVAHEQSFSRAAKKVFKSQAAGLKNLDRPKSGYQCRQALYNTLQARA